MRQATKKAFIGPSITVRREVREVEDTLADGEEILAAAMANWSQGPGVVAVTSRRVVLVSSVPTREALIDMPLSKITSANARSGLFSGRLTITAAERTEQMKVSNKAGRGIASAIRRANINTG